MGELGQMAQQVQRFWGGNKHGMFEEWRQTTWLKHGEQRELKGRQAGLLRAMRATVRGLGVILKHDKE